VHKKTHCTYGAAVYGFLTVSNRFPEAQAALKARIIHTFANSSMHHSKPGGPSRSTTPPPIAPAAPPARRRGIVQRRAAGVPAVLPASGEPEAERRGMRFQWPCTSLLKTPLHLFDAHHTLHGHAGLLARHETHNARSLMAVSPLAPGHTAPCFVPVLTWQGCPPP
jgi:hypothetical protein